MVNSLQGDYELWNRNPHILEIITKGQVTYIQGEGMRNLRFMLHGLNIIFSTIGPMFYEKQGVESNREDGTKSIVTRTVKGMKTNRFQRLNKKLVTCNNLIIASENKKYAKESREAAEQQAYKIMNELQYELLSEVDAMGFNMKEKTPGYAAGITGT